jgi:hypothetical protein
MDEVVVFRPLEKNQVCCFILSSFVIFLWFKIPIFWLW